MLKLSIENILHYIHSNSSFPSHNGLFHRNSLRIQWRKIDLNYLLVTVRSEIVEPYNALNWPSKCPQMWIVSFYLEPLSNDHGAAKQQILFNVSIAMSVAVERAHQKRLAAT